MEINQYRYNKAEEEMKYCSTCSETNQSLFPSIETGDPPGINRSKLLGRNPTWEKVQRLAKTKENGSNISFKNKIL